MPERKVICTVCPMGCEATVVFDGDKILRADGLECQRGLEYVTSEIRAPMRDFFTVVMVRGAKAAVCPVRSTGPIPKEKLLDCSKALADVVLEAPIRAGYVVMKDALGLGVDIVTTKNLDRTDEEGSGQK